MHDLTLRHVLRYLVLLFLPCTRSSNISIHYILLFFSFLRGVPSPQSVDACTVSSRTPDQTPQRCDPPRPDFSKHTCTSPSSPTGPRAWISSADPNLRAKTIAKTVREARARVQKHTSRIDVTHERAARRSRLCDDAVGAMRAVLVDVRNGGARRA